MGEDSEEIKQMKRVVKMAVELALGEIPEDVKEKVEKDWKSGKIKELMREIHKGLKKMDREKLEDLLRGKRVELKTEDTNGQKPEYFTKDYVLSSLLKYLGYDPEREAVKKRRRGKRYYVDYRAKEIYGNWVLIEAEPLHVNLREKEKGINQVDDWMDSETRIGFATNGLNWILHYYKETMDIEEIIELDLTLFFQKIWFGGFIDDEQIKDLFQRLYYYFSKKWIKIAIDEVISAIAIRREEITKKFYKQFIRIVFGMEEKGTGKNIRIEKVGKGLVDYVKAPPNTDDLTKRKFAILFMNRLIFIAFLENINLIPPRALETLYKKWKKSGAPRSFYDEYLKPLFYGVLNTEPENREEHINRVEIFREIPYLNGGLFRMNITDEDQFSITSDELIKEAIDLLEESELTIKGNGGRTLNPDILGYIYEKVINILTTEGRKGLGAYYTPEEITSYIAKNTIEPTVVEKIKKVLKNHSGFDLNFNSIGEVLDVNKPKTRDGDILREILDEINKIRILDPAVGSGHFLISALKILTDIKKRICNIMREPINMYNIKLEIVLNNLYGVDIDGSAVEIAKLRLWLALIENIDVNAVKRRDVVLPNVEYNIRQGNSLIGWVDEDLVIKTINFAYTEKMEKLFKGLKTFSRKERKRINKAEELLRSDKGDILKNYIRAYHLIYEIYRESVGEVASNLKDILEDIRSSIYRDINGAYAEYLLNKKYKRVKNKKKKEFTEKLKERKPFHWRVDFGWIMEDGGFDAIIGNPPHGGEIDEFEKDLWKINYNLIEKGMDSAKTFVERSISLLKEGTPLSFVIPKPSTYSSSWEDFRKYVLNLEITHCIDLGRAFENVRHEQIIIIVWKKDNVKDSYLGGYYKSNDVGNGTITGVGTIPTKLANSLNVLPCKINEKEIEIIRYILRKNFSDMCSFDIFRGLPRKYRHKSGERCIKGKEVQRYFINPPQEFIDISAVKKDQIERVKRKKIIAQNIVAHVLQPFEQIIIMAFPDMMKSLTFETVTNIIPENDTLIKPTTVILNSRFVSWLVYVMIYNKAIRDMHFDDYFVKRILLPYYKGKIECLSNLCDILLFLNTYDITQSFAKTREFIDRGVVDPLVYELYFKEKFHEDGLYPEPNNYLLNAVAKHLKSINYDRYAELYWKKQLEGNLTKEEERELKKLEKENLKIIEGIYKSLKNDGEVQKWIEKIRSHEWVKIIEGENAGAEMEL